MLKMHAAAKEFFCWCCGVWRHTLHVSCAVCCGCVVVKTGANELDTLLLLTLTLLTQKMGKDMLQQRGTNKPGRDFFCIPDTSSGDI